MPAGSGWSGDDPISDIFAAIVSCHSLVMPSHLNPTRRNRNIGTSKQGYGQDNSLVIPKRSDGRYWLDSIGDCQIEGHVIASRTVRFIVEQNAFGCVHPCSVQDVVWMLKALPHSDWAGLDTIVFKQPTRKQLILSPVWGRLLYFSEVATAKGQRLASGPAIFLDAIEPDKTIKWSTSLDPDDSKELERLIEDGHQVQRSGRKFNITVSSRSARNTQLYRTLLHEVGHWFDWLSKVEEPASRGEDWERLEQSYLSRSKTEREAFAHRYADEQRELLTSKGIIPFEQ